MPKNPNFSQNITEIRVVFALIEKNASAHAPTCDAALKKLGLTDIDQEVKDAAIMTTGIMLAKGALNEPQAILAILIERMENEMTRLAAVKALQTAMDNQKVSQIAPKMLSNHVQELLFHIFKAQISAWLIKPVTKRKKSCLFT